MARMPRIVLTGQPCHIIQRGNNRTATFITDDDRHFYLECLQESSQKYGCALHAYVLMTNHVHLLVTPDEKLSLQGFMQSIGRRYVRYFNHTYRRTGTLWEGRYKSALIDSEKYCLTCYRYIEQNPVRAGMVGQAVDYPWSSYRINAQGHYSTLIQPHELYLRLGRTPHARQHAYRALFKEQINEKALKDIRDVSNKDAILGSDRFKEQVAQMLKRRVTRQSHGGDRRSEKFNEQRN